MPSRLFPAISDEAGAAIVTGKITGQNGHGR